MKIRNGFVSNSSSSSFLVGFPRKLKSVEQVQRLLFGDKELIFHDFGTSTAESLAKHVFEEMKLVEDLEAAYKHLEDVSWHVSNGVNLTDLLAVKEKYQWYEGSFEDKGSTTAIEVDDVPFQGLLYAKFNQH